MMVFLAPSAQAANGCGSASWYALTSRTASGEMMNPAKLTAAHKTLPFGTKLKVTNPRNGKSVIVRINDRGPFTKGRSLDLSKAAAHQIGLVSRGHGKVCWTKL
ncbi:MAG: septal ring lytic transglycosylase RlpA family protein [Rhizobiaceae bacterium]|nr:septal ring lytic transglycosylase RlpA family protein [Rhizobiaceae bacterium]